MTHISSEQPASPTPVLLSTQTEWFDVCNFVQSSGVLTGTSEVITLVNAIVQVPRTTGIFFTGIVYVTPGTGTTSITVRLRQGFGTGGTIVWEIANFPVTAGVLNAIPVTGIFTGSDYLAPGGSQSTLTLQQVGATGNGSVSQGYIGWWNTWRDIADPGAEVPHA